MAETNYEIIDAGAGRYVKAWKKGVEFDQGAIQQLIAAAQLSIVSPYVAAMPDCHKGYGSTVGSVIPTKNAVIPAAVGVDIGCFAGDTEIVLSDSQPHRLDFLARRLAESLARAQR
jgi:RNA-splicing ligase RtcB